LNKDLKTGEFWNREKMLIFLEFRLNNKREGRYCEVSIFTSCSIFLGWTSILLSLLSSNGVIDKRLLL
jgi:hypothetical protein